jgi:hypothetical protein
MLGGTKRRRDDADSSLPKEEDSESWRDIGTAPLTMGRPRDVVMAIPNYFAGRRGRPSTVHMLALREHTGFPHPSRSRSHSGLPALLLRRFKCSSVSREGSLAGELEPESSQVKEDIRTASTAKAKIESKAGFDSSRRIRLMQEPFHLFMKPSWNIPSYVRLHTFTESFPSFGKSAGGNEITSLDSIQRIAYDEHHHRLAIAYCKRAPGGVTQPMIAIYQWDAIQTAFVRGQARCLRGGISSDRFVGPELVFPMYSPYLASSNSVILLEFHPENGQELLIGLSGSSHIAIVRVSTLLATMRHNSSHFRRDHSADVFPNDTSPSLNDLAWNLLYAGCTTLLRISEQSTTRNATSSGMLRTSLQPNPSTKYQIHSESKVCWVMSHSQQDATVMVSIHGTLFGWTVPISEDGHPSHELRTQRVSWKFSYRDPITTLAPVPPRTNAVVLGTAHGRLVVLNWQRLVCPPMSCSLSPTVLDDWLPSLANSSAPLDSKVMGIRCLSILPELCIQSARDPCGSLKQTTTSKICYRFVYLTQYGWIMSTKIEAAVRGVVGRRTSLLEIVQIRRRTRFTDGIATIHYQTPSVQYQTPDGKLIQPTQPTYLSPILPISSYNTSSHILWYNDVDPWVDSTNVLSALHTIKLPNADARVLSSLSFNSAHSSNDPKQKRTKSVPKLQLLNLGSLVDDLPSPPQTAIRCLKRFGAPTCVWIHPTYPEYILVGTQEHGIYWMESKAKVSQS